MKMKATKKIVGAACALVAAVALSAGSTFAWFSTNGSVDATGMKIEVNTNNAYLIIADSAENLQYEKKSMELISSQKALLPSAYEAIAEGGTTLDASGGKSIVEATSWYTAQGTDSKDSTLLDGTKVALTGDNFADYVVVDEIYVAVSAGSTAINDVVLSVKATPTWSSSNTTTTTGEGDDAVTKGNNNSAISVVILYQTITDGSTMGEWSIAELTDEGNAYGAADHKFMTGDTLSLGGLQPSSTYANYIKIQVMVYFDGNNADVYTANSANLTGVTLDFNFKDPGPAEVGSGD